MSNLIIGGLIGAYLAIALIVFGVCLFAVCLGGNNRDLWKPFAAAVFWPLAVLNFVFRR